MTVRGSTLNFNKESQLFAKALQAEHDVLGLLVETLEKAAKQDPGEGDFQISLPRTEMKAAKAAHEHVRFQRARTEAARGRR